MKSIKETEVHGRKMWKTSLIKDVISTAILVQMRQEQKPEWEPVGKGRREHIKKTG